MFKKVMLGLTFAAAFGLVGLATPDTSEARRYWRRPFVGRSYYAPPRVYYRSYRPNYAPRYYGYPGDYYYGGYRGYYGPRRGVYFSFGY